MKKRTIIKAFMFVILAMLSITTIYANSWNWTKPYKMPEKDVNTLIVVGNYRIPRLLADLIQTETKQPILLLPVDSDGKIFFMPAKDQTMVVEFDDLTDFIKYLKPGKIIVLGDERYVPTKYVDAIDPSQTVISITNKSWKKVAETTSRILDLTYLNRRFGKYEEKIKSGELYRPENPALGDDALKNDDTPVVILDDISDDNIEIDTVQSDDNVIIDDTKDVDVSDTPIVDPNIAEEPKLIDETQVVPK